jgi:SAM-dependent methyltransferase
VSGVVERAARRATTASYWDRVADEWSAARRQTMWRTFSDQTNRVLLEDWLPARRVRRILKTDVFDEVISEGLYPLLARRAEEVIGIDIATRATAHAQRRHVGFRTVAADARRLPFDDGSFDVIVSNSTLDHFGSLDDLACSLGELGRVVRPGGMLVLTLDNLDNPVIALRSVLPFAWLRRVGLVPYFVGATCGPERLRALLEGAGFAVRDVRLVMHCPRTLAVAVGWLVDRYGSSGARRWYLRHLAAYERLGSWPTRKLTGYFSAVCAVRR